MPPKSERLKVIRHLIKCLRIKQEIKYYNIL